MDIVTLTAIFNLLADITSFLIKYGPGLIVDIENMVADLKLAWTTASGTTITPEQQAQIDAALDAANTALLSAIAAQQTPPLTPPTA